LIVLAIAGCGDDAKEREAPPPHKPPAASGATPGAPPTGAPPGTPVAQLQPAPPPMTKEGLLAEVRKRQLTNDDFVESDTNRDPFRSYLQTFAVQPPIVGKQHKIVLQKFALDELKLVAIVQGDGVTPRAMFVDPSGMGVNVVRGDHVSKADATVERIAPDRVFFEIEEDAGSGKTKKVERVVELHAGEVVTQ
jgi:type IV pilus assembly protein PilP